MSIFSSITCPDCNEEELSIALAIAHNIIRLTCEGCGCWIEIKTNSDEIKFLREILEKRKREITHGNNYKKCKPKSFEEEEMELANKVNKGFEKISKIL